MVLTVPGGTLWYISGSDTSKTEAQAPGRPLGHWSAALERATRKQTRDTRSGWAPEIPRYRLMQAPSPCQMPLSSH